MRDEAWNGMSGRPLAADERSYGAGLGVEDEREQVVLRCAVLVAGLIGEDAQHQVSHFPPNKEDAGR